MVAAAPLNRSVVIMVSAAAMVVAIIMLLFGTSPADGKPDEARDAGIPHFDPDGAFLRPESYRQWVYVGTPITPNDMNGGQAAFPEFHNVYINPYAFKKYSQTGKFPDGTVMIKELVSVGAKKASSGKGYFQGEFIGVEAAVKSSKQFPEEPGNWAYFSFGKFPNLADKAKAHPAASCNGCHDATADENWVFTQFYPILRAAKPKE